MRMDSAMHGAFLFGRSGETRNTGSEGESAPLSGERRRRVFEN